MAREKKTGTGPWASCLQVNRLTQEALMAEKKDETQRNEGEGNRTAAREYNQAQHDFARSGKVDEKAQEARKAVDGVEGDDLRDAELIGKRHVAEEDPEVKH